MKQISFLMWTVLFVFSGLGCHTHTTEVYHEPEPQVQVEVETVKEVHSEPVREVIIEERTTTRVVDEYPVVEGNRKRPSNRSSSYDEDTQERVVEERIVIE